MKSWLVQMQAMHAACSRGFHTATTVAKSARYSPWGSAATCAKRTESNNKKLCLERKLMVDVSRWVPLCGCLSVGCNTNFKGARKPETSPPTCCVAS